MSERKLCVTEYTTLDLTLEENKVQKVALQFIKEAKRLAEEERKGQQLTHDMVAELVEKQINNVMRKIESLKDGDIPDAQELPPTGDGLPSNVAGFGDSAEV